VADGDRAELRSRSIGCAKEGRLHPQVVGETRGEPTEEGEQSRCRFEGMHYRTGENARERVGAVLKRAHDTEIAAAAA
jgi:hypothetical protein